MWDTAPNMEWYNAISIQIFASKGWTTTAQ